MQHHQTCAYIAYTYMQHMHAAVGLCKQSHSIPNKCLGKTREKRSSSKLHLKSNHGGEIIWPNPKTVSRSKELITKRIFKRCCPLLQSCQWMINSPIPAKAHHQSPTKSSVLADLRKLSRTQTCRLQLKGPSPRNISNQSGRDKQCLKRIT